MLNSIRPLEAKPLSVRKSLPTFSYFVFNTLNNFITLKWGIEPGNKVETITVLLDKVSDSLVKTVPVFEKFIKTTVGQVLDDNITTIPTAQEATANVLSQSEKQILGIHEYVKDISERLVVVETNLSSALDNDSILKDQLISLSEKNGIPIDERLANI